MNGIKPERHALHEILPLKTPLSVHIYPSYFCNFKCSYCIQSVDDKKNDLKKEVMDMDIYTRAIDQVQKFDAKLKALIFSGHGEPLTHPRIADMVRYAKDKDVSERVEIVTNGMLLNRDMADALAAAGLDKIRISIQGLSSEKYKEVTQVDADFSEIVENIAYLKKITTETIIEVKVIDSFFDENESVEKFREIFQDISDSLVVESLIPFVEEIDYNEFDVEMTRTKAGDTTFTGINVCPMPFYMLVVEPNGNVVPCCNIKNPMVLGNVKDEEMKSIWSKNEAQSFRKLQLCGNRNNNGACRICAVPEFGISAKDYLDTHQSALIEAYGF